MGTLQKLLLLLAAVLFAGLAAPCLASSTRGEVLFDADVITLGDVFEGMGERASVVIAKAPEPGRKVAYDVAMLLQIARTYNVTDWKPASNYERVTLTRASQLISAAQIRDKVIDGLATVATDKDLDVVMDNQGMEIHRPTKSVFTTAIEDLKYDPIRHRFNGNLVITPKDNDGKVADVLAISGRAMPMTKVAILVHAVPAGVTVSDSDIEWARVPLDKAGADVVSDASQLKGTEMRRGMNAQDIVRTRDLIKERMVSKGSMIMMQIDMPSMQLSAQGRALSDGTLGDTIRVVNTQSNRTIDAVIIGKEKVSVIPPSPEAVASR